MNDKNTPIYLTTTDKEAKITSVKSEELYNFINKMLEFLDKEDPGYEITIYIWDLSTNTLIKILSIDNYDSEVFYDKKHIGLNLLKEANKTTNFKLGIINE